ncbi:hypothetical protein Tco_0328247 [Tanacetum coccineum]
MSVKYPTYVNLTSSSEKQPNERTHSPPPRKKSLSPPQALSISISSKSTHYTSSSSPSESPTPTQVAPPPKLHFVIPIKQEPQELSPLQTSPNNPHVSMMDNWPPGPSNLSTPPCVSRPPPGFPNPTPGFEPLPSTQPFVKIVETKLPSKIFKVHIKNRILEFVSLSFHIKSNKNEINMINVVPGAQVDQESQVKMIQVKEMMQGERGEVEGKVWRLAGMATQFVYYTASTCGAYKKKRNRLEVAEMNNLIYVQANAHLIKRDKKRNREILIGEDASEAQEWIVDGDDAHWEAVGDSLGVDDELRPRKSARRKERELFEDDFVSGGEGEVDEEVEYESDGAQIMEQYGHDEN